eukprot:2478379-Lingulodinium_polyedra.AAC.1
MACWIPPEPNARTISRRAREIQNAGSCNNGDEPRHSEFPGQGIFATRVAWTGASEARAREDT